MTTGAKICSIPRTCGTAQKEPSRRKMMVAVFEVIEKQGKPDRHSSPTGSPFGAPINVCRGRLKSACSPGICDCPDVACRIKKTKMQILATILKYAIFGLAVEEAVRYGIWSDASKTDALTQRYLAWAEGFFSTKNKTQRTPQEVYDMYRIRYNMKNVWNNIIVGFNEFIASLPEIIVKVPNYFFPKEPELEIDGSCDLNKGIRDTDD